MNSIEVLNASSNSIELINGVSNNIKIIDSGLFQVEMIWYFLSPNFPICELMEVTP